MVSKKVKASMTVEAAFVVPIVLFVIFLLIYLTFYLHDLVRMEEILEKGLGKGNFFTVQRSEIEGEAVCYSEVNSAGNWGIWKTSYETEEEKLKCFLEKELEQGFFLLSEGNVSCEINGFSVEIQIKMQGKGVFLPVKNLWRGISEVTLKRNIPIHNPEEVLRIFEGMEIINNSMESSTFVKNHMKNLQSAIEKGEDGEKE